MKNSNTAPVAPCIVTIIHNIKNKKLPKICVFESVTVSFYTLVL